MSYTWEKTSVHTAFVSEAQAIEWLQLESDDYDRTNLVDLLLPGAIERVEQAIGHPLDLATWQLALTPPDGTTEPWKTTVPLPAWPAITDISVAPAGVVVVVGTEIRCSALPPPGDPSLAQSSHRTPTLSVSAGEGSGSGFPRARLLVLRIAAHLNEHRGDMDSPLPRDIEADLASIGPFRGF